MFTPLLQATVIGFVLVLVRTSALVMTAPLLGQGQGYAGHRTALIFFLSVLLYWVVGHPVAETDPVALGAMALREVLIGLFLGFILQLVLLSVRVAGEMVGQEMGLMVARQVDPTSGVSSSLVTNLYENLFITVLFALNGHHWMLRALESSFAQAPIGRIGISTRMASTIEGMFNESIRAGIVFGVPVMVFLLMVSALMGIMARAVPTMNVLEVGFSVRVLVALIGIFLFAPLMEPAMRGLDQQLVHWLEQGVSAL
jgi:flagellar biosynthetic protein FliR